MQRVVEELIEWRENNRMNVNRKKTKEMILGPLSKKPTTLLLIAAKPVQQVTEYNKNSSEDEVANVNGISSL